LIARFLVPLASIVFLPRGRNVDNSNERVRNATHSTSRQTNPLQNDITAYDGQEIIEEDGKKFIERLKPEINLLASVIVHSAMFVFYTTQFGGNNVTGRRTNETMSQGKSSMAAKRSIGMEALNLAYQYPTRESNNGTRRRHYHSNPSYRWHYLMFLQTVIPYMIQRAGRGGWSKDLGLLVSTLWQPRGFLCGVGARASESGDIAANDSNGVDLSHVENENDYEFRNDDRLRGVARRRLFEEQRRRMMSSASSAGDPEMNHSEENLHRVGILSDENEPSTAVQSESAVNTRVNTAVALNRFYNLSWNFFKKASIALSSLSHGAHTLPHHVNSLSAGFDPYTKIIKWLLRLHLALFYWNGTYPTIAHRLAGMQILNSVPPITANPSSGDIIANRPSYKPVSVLILIQAAGGLTQAMGEMSVELAHHIQIAFFRWRRRMRMQQLQPRNDGRAYRDILNAKNNCGYSRDESEREEYLDLIEEKVPGISSAKDDSKLSRNLTRYKNKQIKHHDSDSHSCGVCLNERINPAAPTSCGHVFCWNCILHWVSNVRAECPLCRAKTRPQDIICLYNYS